MITIYCHTNRVNGKRYVGQTIDSIGVRWSEHVSAAKRNQGSRVFGTAIRKYGADSFDHTVLEVVEDQGAADEAERKWIKSMNSQVPFGYNLSSGGGANGGHHENSKRLIGDASRRRILEMSDKEREAFFAITIRHWPEERKAAARELMKSEERRKIVSRSQKELWAQLTEEERSARVRHQLAGMSDEQKSDRIRKAWANLTPEQRQERVRNARAAAATSDRVRAQKLSIWQKNQASLRTPEERSEIVRKGWATRRANLL